MASNSGCPFEQHDDAPNFVDRYLWSRDSPSSARQSQ
jgi:hypothetical protein